MERHGSGTLEALRLTNYKCHKETPYIELAPITLLVGPNSSGKTALVQPLLWLKQTLAPEASSVTPMSLDGSYVDLGTFQDILYNHDPENVLGFRLKIVLPLRVLTLPYGIKQKFERIGLERIDIDYSIRIGYSKSQKGMVLLEVGLSSEMFKFCLRPQDMTLEVELFGEHIKVKERQRREQSLRGLMNTIPSMIRRLSEDEKKGPIKVPWERYFFARRLVENVISTIETLGYIGPVRVYPSRYYVSSGEKMSDVGISGERAIQVLHQDKVLGGDLNKSLNKWLKELGVAKRAVTKRIDPTLFALEIIGPYMKTRVNITHTGFGVSQIIPAIIESHLMPPDSTLILEQPEIHLHPRAQASIADLLIDLTNRNRRFIVETHSEHIILRLQRRVAEKKIGSDKIRIYYFDMSEMGVNIRQIKIDSTGQLLDFPKGFMEEGLEEAYRTAIASSREV